MVELSEFYIGLIVLAKLPKICSLGRITTEVHIDHVRLTTGAKVCNFRVSDHLVTKNALSSRA